MKVMLVNGSPHEKGCTYTALKEVENSLQKNGIETEIFWLGNKPVAGCIGCGSCLKTGECFVKDKVNEFLAKVPDLWYTSTFCSKFWYVILFYGSSLLW